MGTVGNGRTDGNIFLCAVVHKQACEACQQGHERGNTFLLAKRAEPLCESEIPLLGARCARSCKLVCAWMIRWQMEHRSSSQYPFPVGKMCVQLCSLEIRALPDSKIGVLDGQFRDWRRATDHEGVIERTEF